MDSPFATFLRPPRVGEPIGRNNPPHWYWVRLYSHVQGQSTRWHVKLWNGEMGLDRCRNQPLSIYSEWRTTGCAAPWSTPAGDLCGHCVRGLRVRGFDPAPFTEVGNEC